MTVVINGNEVTFSGTADDAAGEAVMFFLTATDKGEPGRGTDSIRLEVPERGYNRSGTLGGGNVQLH